MSLYAAQPARRNQQLAADLLYLLVLLGAVWLAMTVYDAVFSLQAPGDDVETAGRGLASGLGEAGAFLGGVPLIGEEVAVPFEDAAGAARTMAEAGAGASAAVERLAYRLAVVVAALPIVLVSFQYLPGRIGFVRESSALRRLVGPDGLGPAELDLLALRALTRQPLTVLRMVGDDVAHRWREGDPTVVRELAAVELRAGGLSPPKSTSPPTAQPTTTVGE